MGEGAFTVDQAEGIRWRQILLAGTVKFTHRHFNPHVLGTHGVLRFLENGEPREYLLLIQSIF